MHMLNAQDNLPAAYQLSVSTFERVVSKKKIRIQIQKTLFIGCENCAGEWESESVRTTLIPDCTIGLKEQVGLKSKLLLKDVLKMM